MVDDYVIQPAKNCDNVTIVDIGVFCHEFGHALGLPDLYDTNNCGGSCAGDNGIGHWGIMGSGNWNSPTRPAHPCAWTRVQMGWVVPTVVDWTNAFTSVGNINDNPIAYKLPFTDDRFRRSTVCSINGAYSLYCGFTEAEANVRNYVSPGTGGGYGSSWRETVERDFTYSGSGSVTMAYDYAYDLEPKYDGEFTDLAQTIIEVNGSETVLATYFHPPSSGFANHDLTPHLGPLAGSGGTYTLKFRVITDYSFDDDDGNEPSDCGALALDDISVTGGGESYSTDFETYGF
jgi:bacillopeptidase F (M6 metalloprotease family)